MIRALLLACLLMLSTAAFADPAPDPDGDYLKLVDAAMAKPAEAKWCEIRNRYPDTSFYHAHLGLTTSKVTMEVGQKMLNEKTKESVDAFKDFLRKNAASIGAHYYAAYLYNWNNDLVKQKMDALLPDFGHGVDYIDPKFEKGAAAALLACILKTGDGRSEATAYQIMTVDEAETLVDKYYNVNMVKVDREKAGGHVYFVITVEIPDSDKQQQTLYFQLDDRMVRGAIAAELVDKLKPPQPAKTP